MDKNENKPVQASSGLHRSSSSHDEILEKSGFNQPKEAEKESDTEKTLEMHREALQADLLSKKAMKARPIGWYLLCLAMIIGLIVLDQATKVEVAANIPLNGTVEVIPGFFYLNYVLNTGMAFSMLNNIGMGFFIVLTIAVVIAMIVYFFKTDNKWRQFSLALIIAGAIGNMIDRLLLGHVRDFLLFYIFGHPFAIFNVADVCVSVGFVMLVIGFIAADIQENKRNGKKHAK